MPLVARLFWILLLACLSPLALGERLRLVSDDWAPYVYQQNGQPTASTTKSPPGVQAPRRRSGWQFLPWKRCLAMIEQGLADGILDIFQTESRQPTWCTPEPMSDVEFVLFQARTPPEDLAGLTVGTSPGYAYGGVQRGHHFRAKPRHHEANFGKLMLGRIDLAITDRRVGHYLLRQLGLQQQVEELPLVISRQASIWGWCASRARGTGPGLCRRTAALQAGTGLCSDQQPLHRRHRKHSQRR
jgi:polar amino acid transport system substrate-binding protein